MGKVLSHLRCTFCGKPTSQLEYLITGYFNSAICNECIELSMEILTEERAKAEQSPKPKAEESDKDNQGG